MKLRNTINSKIFNYCILFAGLAVTYWTATLNLEKAKLNTSLQIQGVVEDMMRELNVELISATEMGYALGNLLNTFHDLRPNEFIHFTNNLSNRKKGILLIEWQPRVKKENRDKFIAEAKDAGLKNFTFVEPDSEGNLIPAKIRDEHYPVFYAASKFKGATSLGLDLAWSPERMKSKYRARDEAEPMASGTFNVYWTEGNDSNIRGFAVTIPVYQGNIPPNTVEERREKLKGFLAIVYSLNDLFSGHYIKAREKKLNIKILDHNAERLIFNAEYDQNSEIEVIRELNVFGRQWLIQASASKDLIYHYLNFTIWIFPTCLLLLTLGLFYLLSNYRKNTLMLLNTRKDLEAAYAVAKASAESKTIFLANMSHEIRTPMNAILGFGELISTETQIDKKEKYLKSMHDNGKYLIRIIDDILDISKLEEAKLKLKLKKFNMGELIQEVQEMVKIEYANHPATFKVFLDSELPPSLIGDVFRIKQIISNLVFNAFKFTENGQIDLRCEVIKIFKDNVTLQISVKDTGQGMSSEFLKQIFNPFTQEDRFFTRKQGGTGLGLSIVYRLIKLMNGVINVSSQQNKGTTFTLEIPLGIAEWTVPKAEVKLLESIKPKQNLINLKILAAEDDIDARTLLNIFLTETYSHVDIVSNGQELIEKFDTEKDYDLVLTDIQMPTIDGLQATKIIREKNPSIPIIVISAHTLKDEQNEILKAGATKIVTKPFAKNYLIKTINEIMQIE